MTMRPFLGVASTLLASSLAHAAQGSCSDLDARSITAGPDATVRAALTFDDGTGPAVVFGGDFVRVGALAAAHVARWNGSAASPLGAGFDASPLCFAAFDDGTGARLYAGGSFTHAGATLVNHVARWDGNAWSPVGNGFDGDVRALCVFDDGGGPKLFAAGVFTNSGSTSVQRVARFDGTQWSEVGGGVDGPVNALLVQNGTLKIGGDFTHVGGLAARSVADWDGNAWGVIGNGLSGRVNALAVRGTSLIAGGWFQSSGLTQTGTLARWDGIDWTNAFQPGQSTLHVEVLTFAPYVSGSIVLAAGLNDASLLLLTATAPIWASPPPDGPVRALAAFDFGLGTQLFVGGTFERAGSSFPIVRNAAVRTGTSWSPLGGNLGFANDVTALAEFDLGTGFGRELHVAVQINSPAQTSSVWSWNGSSLRAGPTNVLLSTVETFHVHDDGGGAALYAGGAGTAPLHGRLYRWVGTQWLAVGDGTNGTVRALATFDDGGGPALYAGGDFTTAGHNGSVAASRIAKWNGFAWSALGSGVNGTVRALAVHDDGTGAALYVGGDFTAAGGAAAFRIARWDGSTWSPLAGGMTSASARVEALVSSPERGELFAGGTFSTVDGMPIVDLARWNGAAWSEVGPSTWNGSVRVLGLHDFGDGAGRSVYAAGPFGSLGGVPLGGAGRWNGATWRPFPSSFAGGALILGGSTRAATAYTVPGESSPLLALGGTFTAVDTLPTARVAVWSSCTISSFCSGDGLDAHVTTACPCGNNGGPGRGCAWSNGPQGALLAASGATNPDTLVLTASGMPAVAPTTIFLKGDALISEGIVFGDGVRCIAGNLIRLGTKTNVAGAAQYPEVGNTSISVRGGTPPQSGAIGYYQTYFRNAATFCTPSTFNVTNAVRVLW